MHTQSLIAIQETLQEAGVRFILAGGLAVVAHGYLRSTVDVDLAVEIFPDNLDKTFRALARIGYQPSVPITPEQWVDPQERERLFREKNMVVVSFWSEQHPATTLDIFLNPPFDFGEEFKRCPKEKLFSGGQPLPYLSLDTLIALKEKAGRPRDLDDLYHLKALQEDIGRE